MRKGPYKLMYFRGYFGEGDSFELYNHDDDLEELHNLFDSEKAIASQMKDELLESLAQADKEFQKQ